MGWNHESERKGLFIIGNAQKNEELQPYPKTNTKRRKTAQQSTFLVSDECDRTLCLLLLHFHKSGSSPHFCKGSANTNPPSSRVVMKKSGSQE
mmetsp:Transcript_25003/g.30180  ORF Transcript_25003/g.30180 Transcript_25003/m.30180 type:complete len:93 (+) Transcript_25003:146-424(+)